MHWMVLTNHDDSDEDQQLKHDGQAMKLLCIVV